MTSIPIIEMTGPAGRRIINEVDREMWERKGYKVIGSEPAKTDDGGSKTAGDKGSELGNMTIVKLKAFAKEKNIDLGNSTKKADIVAAIEAAKAAIEAAKAANKQGKL